MAGFSLRIVDADFYQNLPQINLDVCYSKFRQADTRTVPVIRIFGATPNGQKTCLHVHQVFPYIYVPVSRKEATEKFAKQFATSLDFALHISLGKAVSNMQHYVYHIDLVKGTTFYGYHEGDEDFLKISLYNPNFVNQIEDLLLNGAIMNRIFQPYEAHIPYLLQFFIDYNLYGMNFIHLSGVKFRQPAILSDHHGCDLANAFKSPVCPRKSKSTPLSPIGSPLLSQTCYEVWSKESISVDYLLPSSIERQSTCSLEVDGICIDILNKKDIKDSLGTCPGLAALWEEERTRRKQNNEPEIPIPVSQERLEMVLMETEKRYLDEVKLTIKNKKKNRVENMASPNSVSPIITDECLEPDHTGEEDVIDESQPIINEEVIRQSFVETSFSQSPSNTVPDDQLLAILTEMAKECEPTSSQVSSISNGNPAYEETLVGSKRMLVANDDNKIKRQEHRKATKTEAIWIEDEEAECENDKEAAADELNETIIMSQQVYDDIQVEEEITDKQEIFSDTLEMSENDFQDSWGVSMIERIPQLDGTFDITEHESEPEPQPLSTKSSLDQLTVSLPKIVQSVESSDSFPGKLGQNLSQKSPYFAYKCADFCRPRGSIELSNDCLERERSLDRSSLTFKCSDKAPCHSSKLMEPCKNNTDGNLTTSESPLICKCQSLNPSFEPVSQSSSNNLDEKRPLNRSSATCKCPRYYRPGKSRANRKNYHSRPVIPQLDGSSDNDFTDAKNYSRRAYRGRKTPLRTYERLSASRKLVLRTRSSRCTDESQTDDKASVSESSQTSMKARGSKNRLELKPKEVSDVVLQQTELTVDSKIRKTTANVPNINVNKDEDYGPRIRNRVTRSSVQEPSINNVDAGSQSRSSVTSKLSTKNVSKSRRKRESLMKLGFIEFSSPKDNSTLKTPMAMTTSLRISTSPHITNTTSRNKNCCARFSGSSPAASCASSMMDVSFVSEPVDEIKPAERQYKLAPVEDGKDTCSPDIGVINSSLEPTETPRKERTDFSMIHKDARHMDSLKAPKKRLSTLNIAGKAKRTRFEAARNLNSEDEYSYKRLNMRKDGIKLTQEENSNEIECYSCCDSLFKLRYLSPVKDVVDACSPPRPVSPSEVTPWKAYSFNRNSGGDALDYENSESIVGDSLNVSFCSDASTTLIKSAITKSEVSQGQREEVDITSSFYLASSMELDRVSSELECCEFEKQKSAASLHCGASAERELVGKVAAVDNERGASTTLIKSTIPKGEVSQGQREEVDITSSFCLAPSMELDRVSSELECCKFEKQERAASLICGASAERKVVGKVAADDNPRSAEDTVKRKKKGTERIEATSTHKYQSIFNAVVSPCAVQIERLCLKDNTDMVFREPQIDSKQNNCLDSVKHVVNETDAMFCRLKADTSEEHPTVKSSVEEIKSDSFNRPVDITTVEPRDTHHRRTKAKKSITEAQDSSCDDDTQPIVKANEIFSELRDIDELATEVSLSMDMRPNSSAENKCCDQSIASENMAPKDSSLCSENATDNINAELQGLNCSTDELKCLEGLHLNTVDNLKPSNNKAANFPTALQSGKPYRVAESATMTNTSTAAHGDLNTDIAESLLLTPAQKPPTVARLMKSAYDYNLGETRHQKAFCSKPSDVPAQTRKIGSHVLRITSRKVSDLRKFETGSGFQCSLESLQRDAMMNTSLYRDLNCEGQDGIQLSEKDFRRMLVSDKNVTLTPCKKPPSHATIKQWLADKQKQSIHQLNKQQDAEKERKVIRQPESQEIKSIQSRLAPGKSKLNLSFAGTPEIKKPSIPKPFSTEFCTAPNPSPRSPLLSPTFESKKSVGPKSSTPLAANKKALFKLPLTPGFAGIAEKTKEGLITPTNVKGAGSQSSQIEGPTPTNNFGFGFTQVNYQDAKNIHEIQHIAILSMELHIETRRDLCPDPSIDPICAIFYYLTSDTNDTKETGIFILDHDYIPPSENGHIKRSPEHTYVSLNNANMVKDDKPTTSNASPSPLPSLDSTITDAASDATNTTTKTPIIAAGTHIPPQYPPQRRNLLLGSGISAYNQKYFNDEKIMILDFQSFVRAQDPDIVIGYEVQMLSWGYLIERARELDVNICPLLSRIPSADKKSAANKNVEQDTFLYGHSLELKFVGRILLNVWRVMRSEVTLRVYTFENVAFHVLHERLPKYSYRSLSAWWSHKTSLHRWRVVEYYVKRCRANIDMLIRTDFISRTSELARLFGILFYSVISRGSQYRVESMMLRIAKPMGYIPVSPSVKQRANMAAPECIPLVMEPESRFYPDPVIVLDFQSLYPSIIIAYNYCFSTCLGRVRHWHEPANFKFATTSLSLPVDVLERIQDDIHISPNGVGFVKSNLRKGILPRMLEDILNTRIMVKNSMKKNKENKALHRMLDARQLGLKLIANVTYGYTSANFSGRMPAVEIADSVVRKARETLELSIDLINKTKKWNARVVYGDTDSVFVLLKGSTKERAFAVSDEIIKAVTEMNPKPVKLKFEKVYMPCILQTKKRYIGYMYESLSQKEPVFDAKGIETVRRDSCPAVSKILERSLKTLFETRDISLVKKYVQRQFTKIMEERVSIQDLTFAKEYRGMKNYKPSACVPALAIARFLSIICLLKFM